TPSTSSLRLHRRRHQIFIFISSPLHRIHPPITASSSFLVTFKIFRFSGEKKLKNALTRSGQRVCLTTDTWTSVQNINYLVITAHFIDDDWNLHKRILNFCQVANHKGDTIGRAIEKCLEGWGIDRLFAITVDNASSNDATIAYLVKKFKGRNELVLDGEFIHIRCCAHILNLIVSDALKDLHVSIIRIRNVVKYVRSSPARLQIFKDFAKEDKMSTKNCPTMDVPTRWNSTLTMLDRAIKCQKTFERLEERDPNDAKTEVARYLDETRIDCMSDEYLDLLTWWKVNSSRFKIVSQVAKDIYSITISTVPSESAFSTGGRVLDSFRSSLTFQTAQALICAHNWIQSKPLNDMIEEIDGAEEIDEGKEMEAAFENLNNDSMHSDGSTSLRMTEPDPSGMFSRMAIQFKRLLTYPTKKEEEGEKERPDPIHSTRPEYGSGRVGLCFRFNPAFRVRLKKT
uniref:HAT C-terminal dimerisation domain-containing protein n=1 Tax=Cucumis melo TaxID=3656 RepID=A0A9I9E6V3_CUCME